MTPMSERRPRRRRAPRASTLPRPATLSGQASRPALSEQPRTVERSRPEHHVVTDYRYVRRDLAAIGVVGALTLAFVIVAQFII